MKKQEGFTLIELIVAFVVLVTLAVFFIIQRGDVEAAARDQLRKTAVNAMYYSLTEGFYKQNGYYPDSISRDNLTTVDPTLFTDPNGFTLHGNACTYTSWTSDDQETDGDCDYKYSASDCDSESHCKQFVLTSDMETEESYKKESPTK
ncbi:type II secretion system GspH family protein [Candidatus Saccharibacteria bacterium]|nr:type II secretion system GspH family protein [Candidatus Saccharibacteria bacterium]MCL1963237.1 type II secretion system GspH family protein [Candidatus Saccharibacteria bacterium]